MLSARPHQPERLPRLGERRGASWPSSGLWLSVIAVFIALWVLTGSR